MGAFPEPRPSLASSRASDASVMRALPFDRPRRWSRPLPDRAATAKKADRASAAAAASARALGHFASTSAPASRDAPAGWPSTRRDAADASHREAAELAAPAGLGRDSESAPSHVLVARALGPVAGRAIVTERRMFLAQIDAAEQRCRETEQLLQEERELLPASRAREEAAYAREAQLREERDAAYAGAEAARIEMERLRGTLDAERARADRAEAASGELRRMATGETSGLREQLEVTHADWRCAEAEARNAERSLAVAQSELRAAVRPPPLPRGGTPDSPPFTPPCHITRAPLPPKRSAARATRLASHHA